MDFKELTLQEQENYIIRKFTTAVRVSKALPRVGPKSIYGIFSNVSDRSKYDVELPERIMYNEEDWTVFEIVLTEWYNAFVKKGVVSPIWKRLWIIFDESLSVAKKCRKLGIGKTYLYSNKQQGIEIIRQYLIRG